MMDMQSTTNGFNKMLFQGFNGLDLFIIIGFVYISYILIKRGK